MTRLVRVTSGLIVKDRRVLFVRSKGHELFYCPGGKIEPNETVLAALARELREEISLLIFEPKLYNIYTGPAPGAPNITVEMICWLVKTDDPIRIDSEIEELKWFYFDDYKLTTEIGDNILVDLKTSDLID